MASLSSMPKYVVTAINGHAPAGGCVYSIMTDYRLMLNNPKLGVGLNETAVGVILPRGVHKHFASVVGERNADLYGFSGTLIPPQQALKIGLVDELCEEKDLLEHAKQRCEQFHSSVVFEAFVESKKSCKKERIDSLMSEGAEERVELWVDHFMSEPIQKAMAAFAARLKAKK